MKEALLLYIHDTRINLAIISSVLIVIGFINSQRDLRIVLHKFVIIIFIMLVLLPYDEVINLLPI